MIDERALKVFLKKEFPDAIHIEMRKLGAGVQGAGFLVEIKTQGGLKQYVIKSLFSEGLGHDYPADRASVFLLDLDEFKNLPRHVKAIDVLSVNEDGSIRSIGSGKEYYLFMEKAEGRNYFHDLSDLRNKKTLERVDIEKIKAMTSYLAEIHSLKKDSKALYWRKIRDTIGHGECLMGIFDTYPEGVISYEEMAEIEKRCIDWRARLKPVFKRLCQIHGDFHPGNIWFKDNSEFILLDRSRGPWGEAADDITALTINYIFFSINYHGRVEGAYLEALRLFYNDYIEKTGDSEIYQVVAPFYAFRGIVVANPLFYPDVTEENRRKLFNFVHGVLNDESFNIEKVNEYIN
jgi:aminoglycoside phosphotransferase (APT) family kinase protein